MKHRDEFTFFSLFSLLKKEAYEITLLYVCLCVGVSPYFLVFYAVHVVSKENMCLVLPKSYCLPDVLTESLVWSH
jgi:hypothetical protein